MSDSQQNPWSNSSNAPNIVYDAYFSEKASLAGGFVYWILYGVVAMVFFRCMAGLFDPVHRRGERVKWGIVSYTVVMFSLATALIATNFAAFSVSYIDNRQFPGGPAAYEALVLPTTLAPVADAMAIVSNWLADGLLLYRCYVIHSMNLWVIVFPCLIYLCSIVTGAILIHRSAEVSGSYWPPLTYLSISVSLNVLLTLMIVIRLVLHTRNTRTALGMTGIGGLSKSIITMLVESCALYSMSSLLVLGPMAANYNPISDFFIPVLPAAQVIASLLIIQRVANKSALTSNTLVTGHLSTFKARGRGGTTDTGCTLPGEDLTISVDRRGVSSGELDVGIELRSDEIQAQT